MGLSGRSGVRGEAKDGPGRAAYRDAAPDDTCAARDPGAGAIDRNAEGSGEVRAEEIEPDACAGRKATHLAAERYAAEGELVANAEACARADGEAARRDAGDERVEASCTRHLDDRLGARLRTPAEPNSSVTKKIKKPLMRFMATFFPQRSSVDHQRASAMPQPVPHLRREEIPSTVSGRSASLKVITSPKETSATLSEPSKKSLASCILLRTMSFMSGGISAWRSL